MRVDIRLTALLLKEHIFCGMWYVNLNLKRIFEKIKRNQSFFVKQELRNWWYVEQPVIQCLFKIILLPTKSPHIGIATLTRPPCILDWINRDTNSNVDMSYKYILCNVLWFLLVIKWMFKFKCNLTHIYVRVGRSGILYILILLKIWKWRYAFASCLCVLYNLIVWETCATNTVCAFV